MSDELYNEGLYPSISRENWKGEIPDYSTAPSASTVKHDQIADVPPSSELDFIEDGTPVSVLDNHPEEYFTAYDKKIVKRIQPRMIMPNGGIIAVGRTALAGYSANFTAGGTTTALLIRDGIDASAPIVGIVFSGSFMYGAPGVHCEYGVYLDANGCTDLAGSIYTFEDFSE